MVIENGRTEFYQWDIGQRLIIDEPNIFEVHFSNAANATAIISVVYEENGVRYANVPDELLMEPYTLYVYACCEKCVELAAKYNVIKRAKPANYYYDSVDYSNSGSFVYEGEKMTINHGMKVLPSKIIVYCKEKGSTPTITSSNQSSFTGYDELLRLEITKSSNSGIYGYKIEYVSYSKFSYYTSTTSTSRAYKALENVKYNTGGTYVVNNITETSFNITTSSYLKKNVEYIWIAIA